jgi:hypothetical protein
MAVRPVVGSCDLVFSVVPPQLSAAHHMDAWPHVTLEWRRGMQVWSDLKMSSDVLAVDRFVATRQFVIMTLYCTRWRVDLWQWSIVYPIVECDARFTVTQGTSVDAMLL